MIDAMSGRREVGDLAVLQQFQPRDLSCARRGLLPGLQRRKRMAIAESDNRIGFVAGGKIGIDHQRIAQRTREQWILRQDLHPGAFQGLFRPARGERDAGSTDKNKATDAQFHPSAMPVFG